MEPERLEGGLEARPFFIDFDVGRPRPGRHGAQIQNVGALGEERIDAAAESRLRRGAGRLVEGVGVEIDDSHDFRCSAFHIFLTLQVRYKDNILC